MGKKAEVGTPKYLANKMKAKGLQKLRWYCQMCKKQCRDQNGFKCHTMSESHQRNLLLFADNPGKFLGEYSAEFLQGFMDIIKRQYRSKRVLANKVYQEYIHDKNHIHMNGTRWTTLTGLVKFLGRTGRCIVDETEKGWYITYIDREPETMAKKDRRDKKLRMDKDDEEKLMEFVERQVQAGKKETEEEEKAPVELEGRDPDEKITLELNIKPSKPIPFIVEEDDDNFDMKSVCSEFKKPKSKKEDNKRKLSVIEETIKEDMLRKRIKQERIEPKTKNKDNNTSEDEIRYCTGIVVKIIEPKLGEKYYKQKAVIEKITDDYAIVVRTLKSNHKLKLDQVHLETVIPQPCKLVKILSGKYRKTTAILKEVLTDKYSAILEFQHPDTGKTIEKEYPYERFSKINQE